MRRIFLFALFLACGGATPAAAQWRVLSPTDSTTRLRIAMSQRDAPEYGTLTAYYVRGTMERLTADSVYLDAGRDSVVAVPRIRILRVETVDARWRGATRVAGDVGLLTGLILLLSFDSTLEISWSEGAKITAGAALLGGVVGALAPWARREEAWLPEVLDGKPGQDSSAEAGRSR